MIGGLDGTFGASCADAADASAARPAPTANRAAPARVEAAVRTPVIVVRFQRPARRTGSGCPAPRSSIVPAVTAICKCRLPCIDQPAFILDECTVADNRFTGRCGHRIYLARHYPSGRHWAPPADAIGIAIPAPKTFWRHTGESGRTTTIDLGYQLVYTNYTSGTGTDRFAYDVLTHGPVIGVSFRF